MLPGFIDSHNHVRLGSDADCVQLAGAGSLEQVRARIVAWLDDHGDAEWVEGEGLDYPALRPGPADLDAVSGGRPVFLFDCTGHGVWVNHAAMRRLGIGPGTGRVPFGIVEKDQGSGEPTGFRQDTCNSLQPCAVSAIGTKMKEMSVMTDRSTP